MLRIRLAALGFLLVLGAGPLQAADVVYPAAAATGLVPPAGMEPATDFQGFIHEASGTSIVIAEFPPEAYPQFAEQFTPAALGQQGISEATRENVTIAGVDAILITGEQTSQGLPYRKWIALVRGAEETAMVTVQMAQGLETFSDGEIRGALMSIAFRPKPDIEAQIGALPFTVGNRAGFRPVRTMMGNLLLLTDGPNDVSDGSDQPIVTFGASVAAVPPAEARDTFARQAFMRLPRLSDVKIESAEGGEGVRHEIIATAKTAGGSDVLLMQTFLFGTGSYVRMVAIAPLADRDTDLVRFRSISSTAQLKQQ